jgi:hypothetical protein
MDKRFWGFLIGTVVVIAIIVRLSSASHPMVVAASHKASLQGTGTSLAPMSLVQAITAVPTSTLDAVNVGTAESAPQPITAPALTQNGKPELFFMGAEYCPYCATERWALTVALSRFGTFSKLGQTHSSSSDVYPNTQTVSYYGSMYTSAYLTFVPVEIYTNVPASGGYTTLQTPTTAEQNLVNAYDTGGSIPFIDFGGRYTISGATYKPSVLQGKSASEIASALSTATSPIAQGADGAANTMIAAICKLTNNQPQAVCDATIQEIENSLK